MQNRLGSFPEISLAEAKRLMASFGHTRKKSCWVSTKKQKQRVKAAGRTPPLCCECCGEEFGKLNRRANFDHCHKTNTFRGWICTQCNILLGMAQDNEVILNLAIKYLRRFQLSEN